MESKGCDPRVRAYRHGKTFDQCKQQARKSIELLSNEISTAGEISWARVMEVADHDELVYKLSLKYLREKGYDIGNGNFPRVKSR
jgi:hypothetical protein